MPTSVGVSSVNEQIRQRRSGTVALIPAYRPSSDLEALCATLLKRGLGVVVVDDGSGEEYRRVFSHLPEETVVLRHSSNEGKGAALKTGLAYIRDELNGYRTVVTADADGQHLPRDIERIGDFWRMTEPMLVLGSRHLSSEAPLRSRFGNTLTRYIFHLATGVKVFDTQTGLRAFSTGLIPQMLEIPGDRYEYELNVLLWAARSEVPVQEEPIRTVYTNKNATSHFNPLLDSLRVYSSFLKFSLSSLAAWALDFALVLSLTAVMLHAGVSSAIALLVGVVGARVVSCTFNFLVNRRFVFDKTSRVAARAAGYFSLAAVVLGANFALVYVGTVVVGLQLWLAKIITEATLFGFSYSVQKRLVFS